MSIQQRELNWKANPIEGRVSVDFANIEPPPSCGSGEAEPISKRVKFCGTVRSMRFRTHGF